MIEEFYSNIMRVKHGDEIKPLFLSFFKDIEPVDLAVTINPFVKPIELSKSRLTNLARSYPNQNVIEKVFSNYLSIDSDRLVITNGASEAISLVSQTFGGLYHVDPDFGMYDRFSTSYRHSRSLLIRSNPNNPIGFLAKSNEYSDIWDESFYPLSVPTMYAQNTEGPIRIGSFTKLFGIPGLRGGFIILSESWAKYKAQIEKLRPQWSLNSVAIELISALLIDLDLFALCDKINEYKGKLCRLLKVFGIATYACDAPWIIIKGKEAALELLSKGIMVRPLTNCDLPELFRLRVANEIELDIIQSRLTKNSRAFSGTFHKTIQEDVEELKGNYYSRLELSKNGEPKRKNRRTRLHSVLIGATQSDAGKTTITAGLLRALSNRGIKVAPFKAQNMSLNSGVSDEGGEISRSILYQARAARAESLNIMNPILIKPMIGNQSQVVLNGKPVGNLSSVDYFANRHKYRDTIIESFMALEQKYDFVVAEGAGSVAELNFWDSDLANLFLVQELDIPWVLVSDIERGGIFGQVIGTLSLLDDLTLSNFMGTVINKFRGDVSLFQNGIKLFESDYKIPVLGLVPYLTPFFETEDSQSLSNWPPKIVSGICDNPLKIGIIRFPHISNMSDFDPLLLENCANVSLVNHPAQLIGCDLAIFPGSKATVADLEWFLASNGNEVLDQLKKSGTVILGICAGYQMLGREINDNFESNKGHVEALGLFDSVTTFVPEKLTCRTLATSCVDEIGTNLQIDTAYQIRHGRIESNEDPVFRLTDLPNIFEGSFSKTWFGTSLHGIFANDAFRRGFLSYVAQCHKKHFVASQIEYESYVDQELQTLATFLDENTNLVKKIAALMED